MWICHATQEGNPFIFSPQEIGHELKQRDRSLRMSKSLFKKVLISTPRQLLQEVYVRCFQACD